MTNFSGAHHNALGCTAWLYAELVVSTQVTAEGFTCSTARSSMPNAHMDKQILRFRHGLTQILITTDIMARNSHVLSTVSAHHCWDHVLLQANAQHLPAVKCIFGAAHDIFYKKWCINTTRVDINCDTGLICFAAIYLKLVCVLCKFYCKMDAARQQKQLCHLA